MIFSSSLTRRAFLKTSSVSAALLATSPWIARTGHAANDRILIGVIGCGDRANALMGEMLVIADKHNVQITAVCDVWQKNLARAATSVKQKWGIEPRKFTRFDELLALKEIDAVTIATPDFSHAPILIAALEAGKDVYVEKPMCIDISSAVKALDLARAGHRVVQVGTQRRSDGHFIAAAKELQAGAIGKVNRISAAMNVNQARWARPYEDCKAADVDWDAYLFNQTHKVAFDPKLLRRWQLYRMSSNGIPGLWMTHYADAVHLLTRTKYPRSVVALGDRYVWNDGREHADTFQALLDYEEGFLFSWGMGLGNASGVHFTIHGTQGTMDVEAWSVSSDGSVEKKFEPRKIEPVKVQGHMENWFECLRSRKRPAADVEYGYQHTVATVMAATAFETGQRQRYSPLKRAAYDA
jgi:predicted dehydrogenase